MKRNYTDMGNAIGRLKGVLMDLDNVVKREHLDIIQDVIDEWSHHLAPDIEEAMEKHDDLA